MRETNACRYATIMYPPPFSTTALHPPRRPAVLRYAQFWFTGLMLQLVAVALEFTGVNFGYCLFELSPIG
jgi:hypothetical protein